MPGIGEIWGCIIAAEIGPFDRFPNADALEFWAGLTADLKESAGRTQSGNITKAGSGTFRWALCQAALTLCQCDARQEAIRQRLIARIGKPKANVAMGRRLLRILYAMVRDGKPYRCAEPTRHNAAANAARVARRRTKGGGLSSTVPLKQDGGIEAMVSAPAKPSRRVGDRDLALFGPGAGRALSQRSAGFLRESRILRLETATV